MKDISAIIAAITTVLFTANETISRLKGIIPKTVTDLVWRFVTRRPIRAPQQKGTGMNILQEAGKDFDRLLKDTMVFLGIAGPSGVKVAADIMAQVAVGGTTPAQVIATSKDLRAFTEATKQAIEAAKLMNGTSEHSVLAPPPTQPAA